MAGRAVIVIAGLAGFSGVVLAALGAHAVPGMELEANYRGWQSASVIHLVHAVALMSLGVRMERRPSGLLTAAAALMALGLLLFSGSVYARVALDLERTYNLAPAGGLMLMLAWLIIPLGLLRR